MSKKKINGFDNSAANHLHSFDKSQSFTEPITQAANAKPGFNHLQALGLSTEFKPNEPTT